MTKEEVIQFLKLHNANDSDGYKADAIRMMIEINNESAFNTIYSLIMHCYRKEKGR